ncbi:MAG: hypothetical protein ACI8PZ_000025 [Myxococcota bacterium]|jgi:hypothetical protein
MSDTRPRFEALQQTLASQFDRIMANPLEPRTVVVVPSLSLDPRELAKVEGVEHYEERLLCLLLLLRYPRTHVVYVTSRPIAPATIDYFLHLLAGIPTSHARERLHLFSAHDGSLRPLSAKLLARPRLLQRIRSVIRDPRSAHLTSFNSCGLEQDLAVALGIPLYAPDPALAHLGTKTGSRRLFKEAGLALSPGDEGLRDLADARASLVRLKTADPTLRKAVVKLNDGFSGEGNATFRFDDAPSTGLKAWVARELPKRLSFEAKGESYAAYEQKYAEMGGIVEAWVDGADKASPSVQCRVWPNGRAEVISTHDQILGGPSGQIFLGCRFPADPRYRREIQVAGQRLAETVASHGVIGRFAADFVSVRTPGGWQHSAIEINLRKGGTTHPFLMLQYLTDGEVDPATGLFHTPGGQSRYYRATDNLCSPAYAGLTPHDLIDLTVCNRLHFHGPRQEGTVFHLIGALSEFGKLGMVCIGPTPEAADSLFDRTVAVLDAETA